MPGSVRGHESRQRTWLFNTYDFQDNLGCMKPLISVVIEIIIRKLRGLGIMRIPMVRRIGLWLIRLASPIDVGGYRLYVVAPGDKAPRIPLGAAYEPDETTLMRRIIRPGDTVLDIGAHIGIFSVLSSKRTGVTGRVLAFEPEPRNLMLLRRNLDYNQCNNVEVIPAAVTDLDGVTELHINTENSLDNRLSETGAVEEVELVRSVCLDGLQSLSGKRIDVIKMDIQGSEPAALDGMKSLLEKQSDVQMLTEFWPHGLKSSGYDPKRYLSELRNCGFRLYMVGPSLTPLHPEHDSDLLNTFQPGSRRHINIYATMADVIPLGVHKV